MILTGIKSITIPEGSVKAIHSGGSLLWSTPAGGGDYTVEYTWEGVAASVQRGTYATDYAIGDLIPLDLGSEGLINMQVAAFDADDLADGSGKAHISFVAKELLKTNHRMNPELVTNDDGTYQEGTGTIGGWAKSEMRTYLNDTIKPLIPIDVLAMIKPVVKRSITATAAGTADYDENTIDDVWIPNVREVSNDLAAEPSGSTYTALFSSSDARKKAGVGGSDAQAWALRSVYMYSPNLFEFVKPAGNVTNTKPQTAAGIALGFCV